MYLLSENSITIANIIKCYGKMSNIIRVGVLNLIYFCILQYYIIKKKRLLDSSISSELFIWFCKVIHLFYDKFVLNHPSVYFSLIITFPLTLP